MDPTILTSKFFIPPYRSKAVHRTQLVGVIQDGFLEGRKLTVISAPAGFGKTTLVSEWVFTRSPKENKIAWISLDEADNDPNRCLVYMIAALQEFWPELGGGIISALQSMQPPPVSTILTTLINQISSTNENITVILDDYQVIENPAVDQLLSFLIEHQPPKMHLILLSREEPDLPLAKYRARNQLTELRAADLRFNLIESTTFLNQIMNLNLSEEEILSLEKRTEGWAAGLQLAALAIRGVSTTNNLDEKNKFIDSFTGSHRFILDYLVEEVLSQQPETIQQFLLNTSILEEFCGPLCDHIFQNTQPTHQKTLETLEKANLFIIPLDEKRQWFRYHHLFRDLLRQRLEQQSSPEEIAVLHVRASEWYETHGLIFDAFLHAVKAGDHSRAVRLTERKDMPLHWRYITSAVLDWLNSLPTEIKNDRPELWVKSASLTLLAGQTAQVEESLQVAEDILNNLELNHKNRDLFGRIACARATLALTRYDPDTMIKQAQAALKDLNPDNYPFLFTANWALGSALSLKGERQKAMRAIQDSLTISRKFGDHFSAILALSDLGFLQELENDLYRAEMTYREVLALTGDHPQPNIGEVYLGLARIYYAWNDLQSAENYGKESLRLTKQYETGIDRFILSEVFLAQVKLAQGKINEAQTMLNKLEETARRQNFHNRLPEITAEQILVFLKQNRLKEATINYQESPSSLSQARLFLAQNQPSEALQILEPYYEEMQQKDWKDEMLRAKVLLSITYKKAGMDGKALASLNEALIMAEGGGLTRIFIDEDLPMLALLTTLRDLTFQTSKSAFLNQVIGRFKEEEKKPGITENTILTTRELEILQLIAQGLTNQEIGERLFLALDTVKGHNRRIFNKLQVKKRGDAIKKALSLGLLRS